MRFLEVERTFSDWIAFLKQAHSIGIHTLHSSSEYESFDLLTALLASPELRAGNCHFRHIVKLAEPSFDDAGFDAERLTQKVQAYCTALSTPVVHDVQWMWRAGLKEDAARVSQFENQLDEIAQTVAQLKQDQRIERFFCFPYSIEFAQVALEHPCVDGLVVYRNVQETAYDALLDRSAALGKPCHIIRPFNAGSALAPKGATPAKQLAAALNKPAIESAILSSNNIGHLEELMAALADQS
jgi:hypothetical protein